MYIHNWRAGTSEWVGDVECDHCCGTGVEPAPRTDDQSAARAHAQFTNAWNVAGAREDEEANRQLQLAARIERREIDPATCPAWWRDEAARAATNLRFVDRRLGRFYRGSVATGQEPDPEAIRPHTEERQRLVECLNHCAYMVHVLTGAAA